MGARHRIFGGIFPRLLRILEYVIGLRCCGGTTSAKVPQENCCAWIRQENVRRWGRREKITNRVGGD